MDNEPAQARCAAARKLLHQTWALGSKRQRCEPHHGQHDHAPQRPRRLSSITDSGAALPAAARQAAPVDAGAQYRRRSQTWYGIDSEYRICLAIRPKFLTVLSCECQNQPPDG
jgi:hypothetical protein